MNAEKSNVLIVDPSPLVTDMLSALLGESGLLTHVAQGGQQALAVMGSKPIDFLCFAGELGDMGGIELYVSARTRKLLSHQIGCLMTVDLRRQILTGALENSFRLHDAGQRSIGDALSINVPGTDVHTGKSDLLEYYRRILESLGLMVSINLVHTASSNTGKKSLTPILAISSFDQAASVPVV